MWEFRDDLMLIQCPQISNVKTELREGQWLAQMYTFGDSFSTLLIHYYVYNNTKLGVIQFLKSCLLVQICWILIINVKNNLKVI